MIIRTRDQRQVQRIGQSQQLSVALETKRQSTRRTVVQFKRSGHRQRVLTRTGEPCHVERNGLHDQRCAPIGQPNALREVITMHHVTGFRLRHRQHIHMLPTTPHFKPRQQHNAISGARRVGRHGIDRPTEPFVIGDVRDLESALLMPLAHAGLRPVRPRIMRRRCVCVHVNRNNLRIVHHKPGHRARHQYVDQQQSDRYQQHKQQRAQFLAPDRKRCSTYKHYRAPDHKSDEQRDQHRNVLRYRQQRLHVEHGAERRNERKLPADCQSHPRYICMRDRIAQRHLRERGRDQHQHRDRNREEQITRTDRTQPISQRQRPPRDGTRRAMTPR